MNASAWAFMLTGRVLTLDDAPQRHSGAPSGAMVSRMGEPVIRTALRRGMRVLARQFVMGRTIEEALARANPRRRWRYSFDMLGEAAKTHADAERYLARLSRCDRRHRSQRAGKRADRGRRVSRSNCPRCIRAMSRCSRGAACRP